MTRAVLALLATLTWFVAAIPVAAHAELEATSPAAGSTVDSPPARVAARFSEALIGDSSIELIDPSGDSAATGGIDPENAERLVLTTPADMPPGEYEVRWAAFSDDGHLERGTFSFTLLEPTPPPATPEPSATAAPTPEPTPEPTDVPLPSPSASPDPAPTSASDVLFPILAALVILGGLALYLLRGRRARRT